MSHAAPSVISGVMSSISLPHPLCLVSQYWPTAYVVAVSLGLLVDVLFVHPRFCPFAESICGDSSVSFFNVDQLHHVSLPAQAVCVVSGSMEFFGKIRRLLSDYRFVIWSFEQPFRGSSHQKIRHGIRSAATTLEHWG